MSSVDPIRLAEREIFKTYGDKVSVTEKDKSLFKFGRSDSASSTITTIMQLAGSEVHETYATGNSIDSVVCTDNSFTGDVSVEGHTISGSNFIFQPPATASNDAITCSGNTPVSLGTSLARATRIRIVDNTSLAAGEYIYVYDSTVATTAPSGVPSDDTAVKLICEGGIFRQSQKASTTLSSTDYWLVSEWEATIGANKTATAEVYLQICNPFVDQFRTIGQMFLSNTQPKPDAQKYDKALLIIPKNHDIRVIVKTVGTTPASDVSVTATIKGHLAIITS